MCKSFLKFSPRPLIGTIVEREGKHIVNWVTYGEIFLSCIDLTLGLRSLTQYVYRDRERSSLSPHEEKKKGERPTVLICADLTESYVVSMLTSVLEGFVLIPIHGALETSAIASVRDPHARTHRQERDLR